MHHERHVHYPCVRRASAHVQPRKLHFAAAVVDEPIGVVAVTHAIERQARLTPVLAIQQTSFLHRHTRVCGVRLSAGEHIGSI